VLEKTKKLHYGSGLLPFEENKKHEHAFAFAHFTCQHNFYQGTPKTSLPNPLFPNGP